MRPVYKVLIAAVIIAACISPFAAKSPDGLDRVAADYGFLKKSENVVLIKSPIADYNFPGIKNEAVGTAMAGITGTFAAFALMYGLARLLKKGKQQ